MSKQHVLGADGADSEREETTAVDSYHEKVAAKLIEQLRQGTAPWQRPIMPGRANSMFPYNPTSGANYRGMNMITLMAADYRDSRWMTYRQARAAGAQVRKGEKGTPIQFWSFSQQRDVLDNQGKTVLDERGQKQQETVRLARPLVRFATVFNAEQIEGLKETQEPRPEPANTIERANEILTATGADIRHDQVNKMFYRPSTDTIHLPDPAQFRSPGEYYATAFHELGHWTGHPTRLDRDLAHPFGSQGYAKEELRAEIASLMLSQDLSLPHDPKNHASYVGAWIEVLQNDPREIFRAASDAERIRGLVMGLQQKQEHTMEQAADAPEATQAAARQYLNVPYAEKDEAKQLGAKWDRAAKAWYVPAGLDAGAFSRWNQASSPLPKPADVSDPVARIEASAAAMTQLPAGALDPQSARSACIDDLALFQGIPPGTAERIRAAEAIGQSIRAQPSYAEEFAIPTRVLPGVFLEIEAAVDAADRRRAAAPGDVATNATISDVAGARDELNGLALIQDSATIVRALSAVGDNGMSLTQQFASEDWQAYQGLATDSRDRDQALAIMGESATLDAHYAAALRALDAAVAGAAQDAFQTKPDSSAAPAADERAARPSEEPTRSYLLVPYAEREQARAAGARWDAHAKLWYAGPKADHEKLAKWDLAQQDRLESTPTPRQEFAARLMDAGARVTGEHPIMDGATHRIAVADDKSYERSGFYVGHLNDIRPAGYFKNNRTSEEFRWKAKGYTLTDEQKAAFVAAASRKLEERESAMRARQELRADELDARRATLQEITAATRTPYLLAKNLPALRGVYTDQEGETLFVPLVDAHGRQWSEQYIRGDGTKRLASEARKEGCFHVVDGFERLKEAKVFVLAEGYATAATIHESHHARVPVAVVAAVDAGNLTAVAQALRAEYPSTPIVIAGDDDRQLQQRKNLNPGRSGALAAAEAVNGRAVFPTFDPNDDPKLTDFEDLRAQSALGVDGLQRQLTPIIEQSGGYEEPEQKITKARTRALKRRAPSKDEERVRRIKRSIG